MKYLIAALFIVGLSAPAHAGFLDGNFSFADTFGGTVGASYICVTVIDGVVTPCDPTDAHGTGGGPTIERSEPNEPPDPPEHDYCRDSKAD